MFYPVDIFYYIHRKEEMIMEQIWNEYENRFNESMKVLDEMEQERDALEEKKFQMEKEYGGWNFIPSALRNRMEKDLSDLYRNWQEEMKQGELLQKEFVKQTYELLGSTF